MPQTIFIVHLNCSGCNADAWLNGIPVTRVESQGYLLDSRPVHEYLLPGANRVVLQVDAIPTPPDGGAADKKNEAAPGIWATLQIKQGPKGVLPDDPEVRTLASLKWQPGVNTPLMLETSVAMPQSWPRWSWLDGASMTLSDGISSGVLALLESIAEGMRRSDLTPYLNAAELKFAELARAYDLSERQTRDNFIEQFRRLSEKPNFEIAPVARENAALRLCADGKVIDCIDASFEPLLRAVKRPDGVIPVRYPIKLAMIGQQLKIIR